MTAPSPRPEYLAPTTFDPTIVREVRIEKSGAPCLYEDGRPVCGMWDVSQAVWRLLIEGVALRTAHQRTTALVDTWRTESTARGPEDTLLTTGAVGMLDRALKIEAPQPVTSYTVKTANGRIGVVCACGDVQDWPDKGMGRAHFGTWKTRHQDCVAP